MSGNGAPRTRAATIRRWRRLHEWTGLIGAAWLAVTALSGVALNHAESWGLLDTSIPNAWLPSHYTDEFHPESTMLNVVLADIHAGRFLGRYGNLLADLAGAALLVSLVSGCYSYYLARGSSAAR